MSAEQKLSPATRQRATREIAAILKEPREIAAATKKLRTKAVGSASKPATRD